MKNIKELWDALGLSIVRVALWSGYFIFLLLFAIGMWKISSNMWDAILK